jgi:hypothetical protein
MIPQSFTLEIKRNFHPSSHPENEEALASFFVASGGNGGIRTLDEALHPILP